MYASTTQSIIIEAGQELKVGIRMEELNQTLWRNVAYRLPYPSALSLPSYTTQNHVLRGGTTHRGPGLPTLIKTIPPQTGQLKFPLSRYV